MRQMKTKKTTRRGSFLWVVEKEKKNQLSSLSLSSFSVVSVSKKAAVSSNDAFINCRLFSSLIIYTFAQAAFTHTAGTRAHRLFLSLSAFRERTARCSIFVFRESLFFVYYVCFFYLFIFLCISRETYVSFLCIFMQLVQRHWFCPFLFLPKSTPSLIPSLMFT